MAASPKSYGGTISPRPRLPWRVAPTADGKLLNTIRQGLVPVAGFAIAGPGFDFDSSLLLPEMRDEFVKLSALLERFPDHPVALFGHADPVGTDAYNKELAGRRTLSVYALLTHQPALWEQLWKTGSQANGDQWNQRHLLVMLARFYSPATGESYFTGKPTATWSKAADAAIRGFQRDHELAVDGDPGPKTRAKLFELYMDLLTQAVLPGDGGGGKPCKVSLAPEQFLGKGADANGKGDYQSCGEHNPAIVLSQAEVDSLPEEDRNHENAGNRRVTLYVFEKGTEIDLAKWPCPTLKESSAACKKRFWSDGEQRRSAADERRTFDESQDTFACRFYHRIARDSPCERPTSLTFAVEIAFDLPPAYQPAPQTFTLVSTDKVYRQTLPAADCIRSDEKTAVLQFMGVRRGKAYSLSYELSDAKAVPIFTAVPLDELDDHGEDTAAPDPRQLAKAEPAEERVNEGADEPLLAFNTIDIEIDPGVIELDPGTALA